MTNSTNLTMMQPSSSASPMLMHQAAAAAEAGAEAEAEAVLPTPMHICDSDSTAPSAISAEPQSCCESHHPSGSSTNISTSTSPSPSPSTSASASTSASLSASASIHRRLAATLNNAGVLLAHLQNGERALSRYQEALQVRVSMLEMTTGTVMAGGGAASVSNDELSARYEVARREVGELSRTYREHRRSEAPRLDLYPIAVAGLLGHEQDGYGPLTDATAATTNQQRAGEEEEQQPPLSPLLIPSMEEALPTEDSSHAALTLFNMGILYYENGGDDCCVDGDGGVDGALKFFDMALDNLTQDRSRDAFLRAVVLNARATIEYRRKQSETAMTILREALQCHQVLAGSPQIRNEGYTANGVITHESVLADKFSLMGRIHYALGNAGEAMDLTIEALQLRRKSRHASQHKDNDLDGVVYASSLWNMGLVLVLKNDARGAIRHLKEFVNVCLRQEHHQVADVRSSNPYFRHVASAQHMIGLLHLKNSEVASAVSSLKSALNLRRHVFRTDVQDRPNPDHHAAHHPAVADSALRLADVLARTGKYIEALDLCNESLRIRRSIHGHQSREVCAVLCLMGSIRQDTGDFDGALVLYEQVLQIARSVTVGGDETTTETTDLFVPMILEAIGNLHLYRGQWDEAIASFTESATVLRRLRQQGGAVVGSDGNDEEDAVWKAIEVLKRSYPAAAAA